MKTRLDELEEMLELGRWMGPGDRYLMLYEGQLAITNRAGLAHWPRGRRQMIAIFNAADCVHGLTSRQWDKIFERLRMLEDSPDSSRGEQSGPGSGRRSSTGRTPLLHPT